MYPSPAPSEAPDPESELDLRSRTDARHDRKLAEAALMELARRLVELPPKLDSKLELSEQTWEVVREARRMTSAPALNRGLRLIRNVLRSEDTDRIKNRLEDLTNASRLRTPGNELERWRARLLAEGDAGISEFALTFPSADRKRLRQLVRGVAAASADKKKPALKALTSALRVHFE